VKRLLSKLGLEELEMYGAESRQHKDLKKRAIRILRLAGAKSIVIEAKVKGVKGRVDVVGYLPGTTIAFECGNTPQERILGLQTHCDIVVHLPFCWTPEFYPDVVLARRIRDEVLRR